MGKRVNFPLPSFMLLWRHEFSAGLFFQTVKVSLTRSPMPQFINLSLRQYHPQACRRHTPSNSAGCLQNIQLYTWRTLLTTSWTLLQQSERSSPANFLPTLQTSYPSHLSPVCTNSLWEITSNAFLKSRWTTSTILSPSTETLSLPQRTINLPLINSDHALGLPVPEHRFQEDLLHHLPRDHSQADLPIDPDTPSYPSWRWSWCLLFSHCFILNL